MPDPNLGSRPALTACPICAHDQLEYQFTHLGSAIVRCGGCGLLMRNPQPSDQELAAIYSEHYFLEAPGGATADETTRLKRATAAGYLDQIEAHLRLTPVSRAGLRLLEVGCGLGSLLLEARSRGYDVSGLDVSPAFVRAANQKLGETRVRQGTLATVPLPDAGFDVAVLADVIEHTRNPLADLFHLWRVVKPGGLIFVAVPSLDSWSAKLMKERWMEFKVEHLFFFDSATMRSLLFRAGFDEVVVSSGWKTLSPEYVIQHFERFPVPLVSPAARAMRALVPAALRRRHVNIVASGINVLARRRPEPPPARRPVTVSVIIPVFNERKTFPVVLEQVCAKSIPGVVFEVVVVASPSTDGTDEAVRVAEDRPGVVVIRQDRALGKGHAVRQGLGRASGDVILIQDADLEYDVNDYDQLLAPIVAGRAAFVMGVRHGTADRSYKLRQFADSPATRFVMWAGHGLFRTLFNVVYGQRLRDPFTMFKVFRRDCLYGLTFESNRFDFDWELVGKLVRSGYSPLEILVNYTSRSFAEGKKVSLWRDPFTYFRACFKYRFVGLRR